MTSKEQKCLSKRTEFDLGSNKEKDLSKKNLTCSPPRTFYLSLFPINCHENRHNTVLQRYPSHITDTRRAFASCISKAKEMTQREMRFGSRAPLWMSLQWQTSSKPFIRSSTCWQQFTSDVTVVVMTSFCTSAKQKRELEFCGSGRQERTISFEKSPCYERQVTDVVYAMHIMNWIRTRALTCIWT